MNRTFIFEITKEEEGLKISEFLKIKHFSSQNLIDLKKYDSVFLNGESVYQNVRIKDQDMLQIQLIENEVSEHIPPIRLPLNIIYEDEDLMVINKPANMPIHPSLNHYENTLANGLAYYFEHKNQPFVFRCINRLDRDTSGLTIVAKHSISAGILGQMIAGKAQKDCFGYIQREYLALVRGEMETERGCIDAPIGRKDGSIIERVVDEKGERAVTHYQVVRQANGHTLLSLVLETGRTHQIRVHLKHIGHPLIGDYLYNPDMEWMDRQALHSYRLKFIHPISQEEMEFTAPLPQDMEHVLNPNHG